MSNPTLQQTIEALAKEKGIEPEVIVSAIEEAVKTASRKFYKTNEDLHARFNLETGQVELFAVKQIVAEVANPATEVGLVEAQQLYGDEAEVGMEIEFPKSTEVLGRIAAQTAKQVIFQKVREAERENVFAEYNQRIGEVVNGTVKRFENGDIILELGRIEAVLPRKEQSRAESYAPADRIRAVIRTVNRSAKGPQIVLSRTDAALLVKLFEQEVPEIYDGTVVIKGAVREAGDRAKVAVYSRERDVDPVGACVGMKGTRVQSIIRELRGEKIDIVEWSDDAVGFVTNALSPAKVQRVSIVDDHERVMEVVVEDKQLSLAIGKKGQNVRLAAKLTGWRIDIKSEEEKRREVEAQLEGLEMPGDEGEAGEAPAPVLVLPDIHDEIVGALREAGYTSAEMVVEATIAELIEVPGIDEATAESVLAAARAEVEAAAAAREEAEAAAAAEEAQADAAQATQPQTDEAVDQAAGAEAGTSEAGTSDGGTSEGGTSGAGDAPAVDDQEAQRE
jgi:transcription termination/antitermination protein NusA